MTNSSCRIGKLFSFLLFCLSFSWPICLRLPKPLVLLLADQFFSKTISYYVLSLLPALDWSFFELVCSSAHSPSAGNSYTVTPTVAPCWLSFKCLPDQDFCVRVCYCYSHRLQTNPRTGTQTYKHDSPHREATVNANVLDWDSL